MTQHKLSDAKKYTGLEVAVVGMSGRFPGAPDLAAFWDNLKQGVESVSFFSEEELIADGRDPNVVRRQDYVGANAYMGDKEYFDAPFFNYRPDEAALMDPQIRLFHECVWNAIEDAGYDPNNPSFKAGLFAGASCNVNWELYAQLVNRDGLVDEYSASLLRNANFMATMTSYALNLRGPSVFMDTACSTSLVAIHMACKSLLMGECNVAIAGGASVKNRSKEGYIYQEGMITSRDGHCRAFDEASSGTVAGDGVGVVVLKTLKNALQDKDHIYAIIKGTGINNDGSTKVGYTAPSIDGQTEAILMAQKWAGVAPDSISFVETHGTGTHLGDPIEIEALRRVFGNSSKPYCALGAVKTNIGHLDAAAGIAGFIKTVLSLHHRQLVPTLHYQRPNPAINFTDGPFYVNTALKAWSHNGHPLRAGVSSFGIGGTNAHIVLEEKPAPVASSASRPWQLLLLSAKTPAALERNAANLCAFLEEGPSAPLADIAYTLQQGRAAMSYRRVAVGNDKISLAAQLRSSKNVFTGDKGKPAVVFLFSGQGAQYVNMYRGLYDTESYFRETVDECFKLSQAINGTDLSSIVFADAAEDRTVETRYAQPLLFIMEYALSRLLLSWGIVPDQLVGHSIGEYTAACLSGMMDLETCLQLVLQRGELMYAAPRGSMLSISITEAALQPLLAGQDELSLAAVNSTELCVVAGPEAAVRKLEQELSAAGYKSTLLHTSHAFHSPMMDGVMLSFGAIAGQKKFSAPQIPVVPTADGTHGDMRDGGYWVSQLRQPVHFSAALSGLLKDRDTVFVEVGPGNALCTFVRSHRQYNRERHRVVSLVSHARNRKDDQQYLLEGIGALWQYGVVPDWQAFSGAETRHRVSLPAYAFEKQEYPVDVDAAELLMELLPSGADRRQEVKDWFYTPSWKLLPALTAPSPSSSDHVTTTLLLTDGHIQWEDTAGQVIVVQPGAGFRELSPFRYELDIRDRKSYDTLFTVLNGHGLHPDRVVHAWSLADSSYDAGLYSVLQVARHGRGLKALVLVTSDVYRVLDSGPLSVVAGMGGVLLKVLSQEYPSLQTSHIDVSLSEEGWQPLLAAEIHTPGNGKVICLRHGRRWGRHYERLETSVSAMPGGGIYLITGGLGGLGYTLSKGLLAENAAGLILTGRVALPPRDAWDTGEMEAGVKARIEKIRELESRGCRVFYSHCDLTDEAAVRELVASSEAALGGRISGVVHAAGIVDGESHGGIDTLTQQDYERQFGPKVEGLEVLRTVLGDSELEFFAATSSLSTVLGGIGFGAYAPANAYMDACITSGVGTGSLKRWTSICFDGLEYGDKTGGGITGDELAEVWRRLMSVRHLPQVVISVSDLQLRLQQWVNREVVAEDREAMVAGDDKASEDDMTASLIGLWEQFFGKQGITAADDFFEIGGNSLKALTMMGRIHKLFNVEVPVKTFFDNSTITLLAAQMNALMSAGNAGRKEYTAIPRAPLKPYYALSSAQKRLYFLYEMDKDSIAYNLPQVVMLEGALDVAKISLAFNQLLARHENLRTFFEVEDGIPVQKIAPPVTCQIPVVKATAEEVPAVINNFIRPFDLHAAPLIRMALVAISSRQHILMVDVHHIIMDGVSENILINDFMALYQEETLPPLQLQYKDFAEWQQAVASQPWMSVQRDFWMREFEDVPTPLELPYDYARPAVKDQEGHIISFDIDTILTGHLKQLAEAEKTTLFMVLLAAYNILLSRVSGQGDVVVGTPVAGRHNSDVEQIMGMFVNTLPLRNQVSGSSSFRELLAAVKAKTLSCFDNQDYQYEALISDLALLRDAGRNPLFDAMFVFQNYEQSTLELPGLTLKPYSTGHAVAKFDMTLSAFEHDGKLLLSMEYATSLFKEASVQRFVTYFINILTAISTHPQTLVKELVIIPAEEAHRLLYEWNNTAADYPSDKSLVELFEQQAQKTPDHIAVEFNEERVTYRQLHHRASQLARHLVHNGVAPGDIVGLMMERSADLIVGMLGIMKAGGAYLPLDATYPEEHVRNMLEECRVKMVLTEIPHYEEGQLHALPEVTAAHTAYIIYTSGSTGKPKGVMVPHRPVVNLAWSQRKTFQITEAEKILQFSTICFDASVEQIWLALLSGATLVMVSREVILDNALFNQYLRDHGVTHLHATPSFLESVVLENIPALKRIIAGGEACTVTLAEKCGRVAAFYNEYGPTETTVTSIEYAVTAPMPDKTYVPIGRPVHNTRVYILGEQLELLPAGARGKLYIGGDGLASGYVNDTELTARKFLWHPLLSEERIYDTGDYARWLPDGQLEFLGRADEQIKIRGYRVELGEITARLRQHGEIQDSIVVAARQGQHTVLVAYYIPVHGADIPLLNAYMREQLPAYMIPEHFIKMEQFPVNRNGKIDRKALPLVESTAGAAFTPPLGDTAEMLADIWSEVLSLNREKIGANSTFFELGGNSLLLIKLQVRMKQRLGINVAVAELFTYSSVAALAAFLDNGNVALEQFEKTAKEEVEGLKNMIDIFK